MHLNENITILLNCLQFKKVDWLGNKNTTLMLIRLISNNLIMSMIQCETFNV